MGRRDRERKERIHRGEETPRNLSNPIVRRAVGLVSRKGVIEELSRGSTEEQVGRLAELTTAGALPHKKLRDAITRNAPKEMDKAIKKYRKQGKEITVDSLLVEVRSTPGFLAMCEKAGLDEQWFVNLARARMKANGAVG